MCFAAQTLWKPAANEEKRGEGILDQLFKWWLYTLLNAPIFLGLSVVSHHSPCVVVWWTSWVVWPPPSSSGWRYYGKGQPGRWAGSPSAEADCGTLKSFPGMAGRSTEPAAPSCSSRCFQTKIRHSTQWNECESKLGGDVYTTLNPHRVSFTYIDQAEVVLIYRKLLRSNLFLQSRGIGALYICTKPKKITYLLQTKHRISSANI